MRLYRLNEIGDEYGIDYNVHYLTTNNRVPIEKIIEFWLNFEERLIDNKLLLNVDKDYLKLLLKDLTKTTPAYLEKGQGIETIEREAIRYIHNLGDITEQELATLEKFEIPVIKMTDKY